MTDTIATAKTANAIAGWNLKDAPTAANAAVVMALVLKKTNNNGD